MNHMVGIRQQRYHDNQKEHKVSDAVQNNSPTKNHQKEFMYMNYQRVLEGNIMVDVGDGVKLKQADRARLDKLGHVKSHSCFVNDPERLNCMNQRTSLALSVGMVDGIQKSEINKNQRVRRKGCIQCFRRKLKYTNVERLVRDISQRIT